MDNGLEERNRDNGLEERNRDNWLGYINNYRQLVGREK